MTKTCKVCGSEYEATRKTSQFCSANCRQQHKRGLSVTQPEEVSVTKDSVTPHSVTDRDDVKKLNRDDLYTAIQSYTGDEWIDSPEYFELIRRLETWNKEQLKDYIVPVRFTDELAKRK